MLKTTLAVNSKWRLYLYGSTAAEECDKEDDAAHHDQEHRRVEEVVTKEVQVFSKQIIIAPFITPVDKRQGTRVSKIAYICWNTSELEKSSLRKRSSSSSP